MSFTCGTSGDCIATGGSDQSIRIAFSVFSLNDQKVTKAPRWLKIIALIWIAVLLLGFGYVQSQTMIPGKWFDEEAGMVIIAPDGTLNWNGAPGTWEKKGFGRVGISFLTGGGGPGDVTVSRGFGSMRWELDRRRRTYQFEKVSSRDQAVVDRMLEETPAAKLIRRWVENEVPRRVIILKDGREGFSDDLIRRFLNSKHAASLTPDDWMAEYVSFAGKGKLVDSLDEIPGYQENPSEKLVGPLSENKSQSDEVMAMVLHSYQRLGGVLSRIEAQFQHGVCLSLESQVLDSRVGDAHLYR